MVNTSNENYIMTDQFKRIQGATLKILNKNYYIYKGVNTIGRNKTAIINLKNLNVSQHHAVIIILDDSQHFLSDLNSSNGTYLLGTKLFPYKLYELTDNAEVKFGDLIGTYFKVTNNDTTIHLEMENSDTTQTMSQNFYGAATQFINESSLNQTREDRKSLNSNSENNHEAATQMIFHPPSNRNKFSLNTNDAESSSENLNDFHDAPTQRVDHHLPSTSRIVYNINEEETQEVSRPPKTPVQQSSPQNNSQEEQIDIHEVATQVVHRPQDLKTNETCENKKSQTDAESNEPHHQISIAEEMVIEETVLEESVRNVNENSTDSLDFMTLRHPFEESLNDRVEKIDNESNFGDSQPIGINRKRPVRKLSSSEDFTQNNKTTYNSDSDTDIEDVIKKKSSAGKAMIGSDSDTEIEEDRLSIKTKSDGNIQNKSSAEKAPVESDADTEIEEDKSPKEISKLDIHEQKKSSVEKTQVVSGSDTEIEDERTSQKINKNLKNKHKKSSEEKTLDGSDSATDFEEERVPKKVGKVLNFVSSTDKEDQTICGDSLSQTQDIIKPKILSTKSIIDSDSETDLEDNKEKEPGQNETNNASETLNDTDCIPATQDVFAEVFMFKDLKTSKLTNSENVSSEDSFRLGLTELMVESAENRSENKESSTNEVKLIDNSEDQLLGKEVEDKVVENDKGTLVSGNEPDDLYMMPTQKISMDNSKDADICNDQNAYEEVTQKLDIHNENNLVSSNTCNSEKTQNDDVYIMPTQQLGANVETEQVPSTDLNNEKEAIDDFYMMPTQKLSETEQEFKTPQKIFHFKKKNVHLEGSLSNIFNDAETDPYMAATQRLSEAENKCEDIYLLPTQKLEENKTGFKLGTTEEEDFYMAPTQKINIDVEVADNVQPEKNNEHLYEAPTQTINLQLGNEKGNESKINLEKPNKNENEDPYMAPTQQICISSEEETKVITNTIIPKVAEQELYMKETQPINSSPSTSKIFDKKEDPYIIETQPMNVNPTSKTRDNFKVETEPTNSTLNTTENIDDPYSVPTQKLSYDMEQKSSTILKNKTLSNENILPSKRSMECDLNTSQPKKFKIINDEVETLSQIDAFIKQPFKTKKKSVETDKPVSEIHPKEKEITSDQSETLSQIQRFVAQPLKKTKTSKTKTDSEKKKVVSCDPHNEISSVQSETLSQIQAFIKEPFNNDKQSNSTISKLNSEYASEKIEEQHNENFQKPEKIKAKSKKQKSSSCNDTHVTKEECKVDNTSEAELNVTDGSNSDWSNREQDSIRGEVEKSFALLEAKTTKTRKSHRTSNATEIKVTVSKNRRSMTTSAVPESSVDICEKKPSTRNSRRKPVINNNDLISISESTDIKVARRSKRKFEPVKEANVSEPEKPNKILKMIKTEINDKPKEESSSMNEPSTPSTSKVKTSARISRKDLNVFESEKPNKILKMTKTKIDKLEEEGSTINEPSTPSTSKLKTNTRKSRKDTNVQNLDSDSSNSVVSTPSRRGKRVTQNTTFTSPEKAKRRQKPKIVFTMLDSPLLESLIKQLGGSVVDSIDSSTVLVTEHVKRSQKLLTAIGQGKPICSPEWIHASKKAKEFLDPWDFILLDKEAESKWNFSLKESLTRANNERLFNNYTFQLMVTNAADVLKGAIDACGGKCVPRHPAKNSEGYFVVVASPENRTKYLKIKKQHPEVTVVEPEAIFDGVLRQDLRLGRHLLT